MIYDKKYLLLIIVQLTNMALSKELTHKGLTFSYWILGAKEYDKMKNVTRFALWGYRDKDARDESVENYIPDFSKVYEISGDKSTWECYAEAKKSVLHKNVLKVAEPAKTRIVRENDEDVEEIVEPEIPEEFEMIELNPLVNSLDA